MRLNNSDYRAAALEHLDHARRAYDRKDFMVAHYYSGVSVECILRAYVRHHKQEKFYSRHDLARLAVSGFLDIVSDISRREWDAKIGEMNLRWRSNHRYFSEQSLRRYFKDAELDRKIRGDALKENARIVRELAHEIVGFGEMKWITKMK
ncbi:MAG: hypothetical protein ABFD83_15045 [Armatimonadota bacterium]